MLPKFIKNPELNLKSNKDVEIEAQRDKISTSTELNGSLKKVFHTELVTKECKKKSTVKTTEFYYLLQRKTFRMMKKFYKEQFETYTK